MRQRPLVFPKLAGAQCQHIIDSLHGMAAGIAAKLLIAKDGEPLFKAKLKPIAAGDTVACPIVEIFMGNDAFNPFEISISRCLWAGQHIF